MGIIEFFIFIIKVILLLAVILIFNYVNTKKSHIEKVEKLKEGVLSKEDKMVDQIVKDSLSTVNGVINNVPEADVSTLTRITNSIDNHPHLDEKKKAQSVEGFGNSDDDRDEAVEERRRKLKGRTDAMENQVCKYEGYTAVRYIYLFFYYLLFIFIWLAKAMYNLMNEETKRKPKTFFQMLFSPFSGIFWIFKKILGGLLVVLSKLKYVFFLVISTFANILFVPVPDFIIEILSYFLSPFIILFRKMPGGFNPFGSVCWKKP